MPVRNGPIIHTQDVHVPRLCSEDTKNRKRQHLQAALRQATRTHCPTPTHATHTSFIASTQVTCVREMTHLFDVLVRHTSAGFRSSAP